MKKNTIPFSVLCVLTLLVSACGKSSDDSVATVQPPSTSCAAPQVLKDGSCQTPSVTVSTAQVKIESVSGVTIQPDYKIITTNGDEISIAEINNKSLAAIEPNERQAVVLVDKNDEPILAAMRFDTTKTVDINLDSTTLYFILNHPLMLGQNLTNVQMADLFAQIQASPLYQEIKNDLQDKIHPLAICPLQHDCSVSASKKAGKLLLSLPLFVKAQ